MATATKEVPKNVEADLGQDVIVRRVRLDGRTPIMFDRYPGDNVTKVEDHQRLYFAEDLKSIVLPAENFMSFLGAQNTNSAPKVLLGRGWQRIAYACLAFVTVEPFLVPFTRNGKPLVFGGFKNNVDAATGITLHRGSPGKVKGGIPNPGAHARPVLHLPWSLEFTLTIYRNDKVTENMIRSLFLKGGREVCLGTYRPVFGKYDIGYWGE